MCWRDRESERRRRRRRRMGGNANAKIVRAIIVLQRNHSKAQVKVFDLKEKKKKQRAIEFPKFFTETPTIKGFWVDHSKRYLYLEKKKKQ